jgi:hypothetical protein
LRFRNSSSLSIPRRLWEELAAALSLGGILPGAVTDDLGMYPTKTLRITIHRARRVPAGQVVTTGRYTYGQITMFPCIHCTPASLTQVYLQELVHAWLHQYHPRIYERLDSCRLAERFANAGYRALGGRKRKVTLCGSYSLPSSTSLARLYDFRSLAKSLTASAPATVGTWRPKPAETSGMPPQR